jgi:hypothetical protein
MQSTVSFLKFFYPGSFAICWVSISVVDFGFLKGFDFGFYFFLFCKSTVLFFFFLDSTFLWLIYAIY